MPFTYLGKLSLTQQNQTCINRLKKHKMNTQKTESSFGLPYDIQPGNASDLMLKCQTEVVHKCTTTDLSLLTTTVLRPFVRDYPSEPVPEDTFTHSYQSWSSLPSEVLYHLIFLSCGPSLTSMQHTILHPTAVQSPSHCEWYILTGKQWCQLLVLL